jgi:phosphoribosylformimino-5-aminoimidazole carboxamide ribotide isomerase
MNPVIPVLDLMISQVVLAAQGDRETYQPVHSKLTHSSQPIDVAKAIFNQTGCDVLYLADIDSFNGASPNWNVYNDLLNAGFGLWIDANWVNGDQYQKITEKIQQRERLKIILSSETLANFTDMNLITKLIELNIVPIFSLDKKSGKLLAKPGNLANATSLELIQHAFAKGIQELILLDLESVGTMIGCSNPEHEIGLLIQEIKQELPEIKIISGGGVRHANDIQTLLEIGCDHVLVASAIHQCKLTPDDISNLTSNGQATRAFTS